MNKYKQTTQNIKASHYEGVMPDFVTSTNYRMKPKKIKELDKTRLTESAGYVTVKQRVESLLDAGKRLVQARSEMYDFPEGNEIDENFEDPTRDKNFDLADATQLELNAKNNIEMAMANDKIEAERQLEKEKLEKEAKKPKKKFGTNKQKPNDAQSYHEETIPDEE